MGDGLHYDPDAGSPDVPEGDDDKGAGDDYKDLASEAFPDEDWTPERVGALKALIKMCAGGDMGDPGGDEAPDAKKSGLALIFGKPTKK